LILLVGRAGIEPTTNGLKVHTQYPALNWLTRPFQFRKSAYLILFTPSKHAAPSIFAEQKIPAIQLSLVCECTNYFEQGYVST